MTLTKPDNKHESDRIDLHERLQKSFDLLGIRNLNRMQQQVMHKVSAPGDLVVSSPTGTGKTAAFVFPILNQFLNTPNANSGCRALILSPTRELALQLKKNIELMAKFTQIRAHALIGGELFKHQIASIRRNPEIIVATPGRLVEHLDKRNIDFDDLEYLVIDEADLMLDMGFAEALLRISSACSSKRKNLLFSATFGHRAFSKIKAAFNQPEYIKLDASDEEKAKTEHRAILADDDAHKHDLLVEILKRETPELSFVFCRTRLQAQKVSNLLRSKKVQSEYIHGELSQSERKQVLNRFRDRKIQVLVATDLAARGLDISGLDLVVHFTVAASGDDYSHRTGRTARAGAQGISVSLIDESEWNKMASIARYLKVSLIWKKLSGLEAKYKGPKKLKKSGKAAGSKKKVKGQGKDTGKKREARGRPKTNNSGKVAKKTRFGQKD